MVSVKITMGESRDTLCEIEQDGGINYQVNMLADHFMLVIQPHGQRVWHQLRPDYVFALRAILNYSWSESFEWTDSRGQNPR